MGRRITFLPPAINFSCDFQANISADWVWRPKLKFELIFWPPGSTPIIRVNFRLTLDIWFHFSLFSAVSWRPVANHLSSRAWLPIRDSQNLFSAIGLWENDGSKGPVIWCGVKICDRRNSDVWVARGVMKGDSQGYLQLRWGQHSNKFIVYGLVILRQRFCNQGFKSFCLFIFTKVITAQCRNVVETFCSTMGGLLTLKIGIRISGFYLNSNTDIWTLV